MTTYRSPYPGPHHSVAALNTHPGISILTRVWWLHYLCTVSPLPQHDLFGYVQPWFNTTRNAELGGAESPKHAYMVGELSDEFIRFPCLDSGLIISEATYPLLHDLQGGHLMAR